jgi:single-strand DNA-binding protein
VAWRGTAEFVCKYFRKGQLAAVQGSIQTRTYTDRNENKRKAFEIVADNVHFAEPKRSSGTSSGNYSGASNMPADNHSEQPAPAYANGDTGDFEEIPSDDDLPF